MEENKIYELKKLIENFEYQEKYFNIYKNKVNQFYLVEFVHFNDYHKYNIFFKDWNLERKNDFYLIKMKNNFKDKKIFYVILLKKWFNRQLIIDEDIYVEKNIQLIVNGYFDSNNFLIVDGENNNFIMFFPKTLLNITSLVWDEICPRMSYLKGKFYDRFLINDSGFKGTIFHRIYELILIDDISFENNFEKNSYINSKIDIILKENLEIFFILENKYLELKKYLYDYTELVIKFKKIYILDGKIISDDKTKIIIKKITDSEQFIHSEKYGIKGKLDILLECIIIQNNEKKYCTIPLELKTGKKRDGFESQVLLYFSIINTNCKLGLIHYLSKDVGNINDLKIVYFDKDLFNSLLIKRNVKIIKNNTLKNIPNLLNNNFFCNNYCTLNNICSVEYYNQKLRNKKVTNNNNFSINNWKNIALNKSYIMEYFTWILTAINDEEHIFLEKVKNFKYIIKFDLNSYFEILQNNYINSDKILVKFSYLSEKEFIIVDFWEYLENEKFVTLENLSINFKLFGEIYKIDKYYKDKLEFYNLEFIDIYFKISIKSILELKSKLGNSKYKNNEWSLYDKNINNFIKMRTFLYDFIWDNDKIDLVYNYKEDNNDKKTKLKIKNYIHMKKLDDFLIKYKLELNNNQKTSILESLETNDLYLILGYPGTGKTYTIAVWLGYFIENKIRCLITAYTHNSLNNILNKLLELFPYYKNDILQLNSGYYENINVDTVQNYKNLEELKTSFNNKILYFSTILSLKIHFLKFLKIEYCIVEESSLIHEPLIYPCIKYSKKYILIGDFKQINPLVKTTNQWNRKVLGISLLEKLYKKFPDKSTKLTYQYRMNNKIMEFNNRIVYNNELKAANKGTLDQVLIFNNTNSNNFDNITINISLNSNVCFVNLDKLQKQEYELLIINIIKFYIYKGIQSKDIGILSLYNDITDSLTHKIQDDNIFISTIDKSQGLDKDIIIWYLFKKNKDNILLQNINRLNVGMTRSKKKLIIIGSLEELENITELNRILKIIKEDKLLVN